MNGNQGSNGVPAAQNGGESAAEDGFDGFTGFCPRNPVKTVIVGSTGRMKMTKSEVKDEQKQAEGDPVVKGQQRKKMMEMMSKRM